ncbi:MAG TPA: Xaa-Pro peptidase family protein [Terriglobales bacterium]
MNYERRFERVRQALERERLDALVTSCLPNIRYLCGFTGTAAVLIVSRRESVFCTDGRYTEQSRAEVRGARVKIVKGKRALATATAWLSQHSKLRRIGIEPAHLTVAERDALARSLPRGARLIATRSLIEQLRMIKEVEEVDRIRQACHLGSELFKNLAISIQAGRSEAEIAGELELAARQAGAEQMSFPTIIASGKRSALPHGRASREAIPPKGFVVCDFGVILASYCSDMTRTLHVGRPQAEARAVYEAVREAQQAAVEAVKPGNTVGEVDQAARKLLQKRSLGKFFTHSTGHGLGLEVHEAPRVAAGQPEVLRPGMVITIEPGVYQSGKGGVRIEDTVVVTGSGCEILTPSPKELIVV